ncbi:MAG: single stranded DNA-binding domain-containing protein [Thermoplasmatota archaeon]
MKASEVKDRSKVDSLEVTIVKIDDARSVNSRAGESLTVADADCTDADGTPIKISFWNDEIQRVKVGNKIRITNGWASAFRGQVKVSAGKYGKLEVLS